MANSKYEYVKSFEQITKFLPNTYIVVRIDGRCFHQLSSKYNFAKPNDRRALDLMNAAAVEVMNEVRDIVIGYGISDEFSFVFDRSCRLFERREMKIVTTIVSTFTAYYINLWPNFFPPPETPSLSNPLPSFDGRAVEYPTYKNIRDYLSWRQVDCHINNLYNTTFWALRQQGGRTATEAENELKGTLASDKHEILHANFKINYNNEAEIFKKGSLLYRQPQPQPQLQKQEEEEEDSQGRGGDDSGEREREPQTEDGNQVGRLQQNDETTGGLESTSSSQKRKNKKAKAKAAKSGIKSGGGGGSGVVTIDHVDIIKEKFWVERPWLLLSNKGD